MRTKITLALLLLNVGLFYYIFYIRHHDDKSVVASRVLGVEVSSIQTIAIRSADASIDTRIERRGDQWMLASPVVWPANEFAVKNIITELEYLRAETSFAVQDLALSGQTLADYGLEKPSLTLSFTSSAGPAPVTLKIGDTTKVGNRLYILSPDGARIFVVNRSLAETLALKLDDLRSASLFTIPVFEARALNIESGGSGARVRIRRDNERWAIESPIQTRASKIGTELAISGLGGLQVKTFAGEEARAALATPRLRVTLEGNNRRETLLIGSTVPPGAGGTASVSSTNPAPTAPNPRAQEPSTDYYARMEKDGGPGAAPFLTLSIPDRLLATLDDAARELRETRILDFSPENVSTITIDGAGAAGEIVLQRLESNDSALGAAWQIARRTNGSGLHTLPADREIVARLLRDLERLRVEELKPPASPFVNDAPSDAEKENYGFNRPAREVTLVFGAPVSPSGVVTAPPPPIVLQIGDGTDRLTYARLASQNYVYRVPPRILEEISLSTLDYRERTLRELPAGAQITALKLTDLAAPAGQQVILETALPAPAGAPLREAIDALAAQLRTLRAKSFVAEQFTATVLTAGEERPWRYRLDATLSLVGAADGQTTTSTLFFAIRSGGATQLAGSPEFNAVFAAEQPLLDALFAITHAPREPAPLETGAQPKASGTASPPAAAPSGTGSLPAPDAKTSSPSAAPVPASVPALAPALSIPAPSAATGTAAPVSHTDIVLPNSVLAPDRSHDSSQ
ncbi:hypothetical protein AW736_12490 [Termitidicoccus mucosus]|uniref:DUF4340 domain-containing protein n=1 Tax=Termitidicoccus mucosus TaxID=1184151 RepID=A0A178IK65_9BACT|nr:hypothetical protein AW736_12490 [Opitutaceae bacterium TSB47]